MDNKIVDLNTNKAGMDGLDKEKINAIIRENSIGSKFYVNEERKQQQLDDQIKKMQADLSKLTEADITKSLNETDKILEKLRSKRVLSRVVVHVDMDAFFAAVEMRDDPSLRNKPMAVGCMSMLSTSNYVARRYGVRAAMPGFIAKKICPELVIIPLDFTKYSSASEAVREVFSCYDSHFEPMSLDEAYLDFTYHLELRLNGCIPAEERTFTCPYICSCSPEIVNIQQDAVERTFKVCCTCLGLIGPDSTIEFGTDIQSAVDEMRFRIFCQTQLTASAGIAANGLLAKIGSDKHKPNGQFMVPHTAEEIEQFMNNLPVRKIPGVGKVSEQKLLALGVRTCGDILKQRALIYHAFSPISLHFYLRAAIGVDGDHISVVDTNSAGLDRKSRSVERTFNNTDDPDKMFDFCKELAKMLSDDLHQLNIRGKCITLKLKMDDFEIRTRAHTIAAPTNDATFIAKIAHDLLQAEIRAEHPHPLCLRLMGLKMSQLIPEDLCPRVRQWTLWEAFQSVKKCQVNNESTTTAMPGTSSYPPQPPLNVVCADENAIAVHDDDDGYDDYEVEEDRIMMNAVNEANSPEVDLTMPDDIVTQEQNVCYYCPVCNKPFKSQEAVDSHIDYCLSRDTIFDAVRETFQIDSLVLPCSTGAAAAASGSPSLNKRSSNSSPAGNRRPGKKMKPLTESQSPKVGPLDKYFSKNSPNM